MPGDIAGVGASSTTAPVANVDLNFVTTDVSGGGVLQWADKFTDVTDLVNQAIAKLKPGQKIHRLVIAGHGAEHTEGFFGFDPDTSGVQVIDGGTKQVMDDTVKTELARLRPYLAPDAVIEFRVCKFGAGKNGTRAMQAVADATGAAVTAPMDSISSLALIGGLATSWRTSYPGGKENSVSFWRGDGAKPEDAAPPTAQYVPLPGMTSLATAGPGTAAPAVVGPASPSRAGMAFGAGVAVFATVVVIGGVVTSNSQSAPSPSPKAIALPVTLTPIRATFVQSQFTTTYQVQVSDPAREKYVWHWAGPNCGTWMPQGDQQADATSPSTIVMTWSHPHPPCAATTNHSDVQVSFTVEWSGGTLICVYQGSESGEGPSCKKL